MESVQQEKLEKLAKLIRYYILTSTTAAGSGHPTSSMSATELMTGLLFDGVFKADLDNHQHPNNDRLIFSKGHASPLFYSLYAAAGKVTEEELLTLRQFTSRLEGHPTLEFPYTESATGSLGQGLSIGVGMAMNAKLDNLPYRTYVLLGDSEMAEGSVWEAMQVAAHYKLDNLVGIIDVNRLGQRGQTMHGHDVATYDRMVKNYGWRTFVIDGHSITDVCDAYQKAMRIKGRPVMIIAKTLKGKGVPFMEDKDGWHGRAPKKEECEEALKALGDVDKSIRGEVAAPKNRKPKRVKALKVGPPAYDAAKPVATRRAYGDALNRIAPAFPNMVVLDGEVSNSTYAEIFKKEHPDKFYEMYIAEQNLVGTALGFSRRGKIPFVSTFATFFSRAFDQIRMCQYSDGNVKFCGSHAGVSIGEDGASQMGLEDIAMFRTLLNSVVLYPSDATATDKLVEEAARHHGNVYIRTTRSATPILYNGDEKFPIGGSKVLRRSANDEVTVVTAGITLHEALAAADELAKENINIRVIDLYSIKPIDNRTLNTAAGETKAIITVEDHYAEGGLGEAVRSALEGFSKPVFSLAVTKMPRSGKPDELLDYEGISKKGIMRKVKELL